jgi:hypothetical protein
MNHTSPLLHSVEMQMFLILKQVAATVLCSVDDTCGRVNCWANSSASEAGEDVIYLSGCWDIISLTFEALLPA